MNKSTDLAGSVFINSIQSPCSKRGWVGVMSSPSAIVAVAVDNIEVMQTFARRSKSFRKKGQKREPSSNPLGKMANFSNLVL